VRRQAKNQEKNMHFRHGHAFAYLLACLLAFTYAERSLFGQEAQDKKPATAAPRLVVKEKFRAERANRVGSLKFSPDGKLLAEIDETQKVSVCDALTGEQTILFSGYPKGNGIPLPRLIDFSPDGRRLIACTRREYGIAAWDVESGRLALRLGPNSKGSPSRIAFHPKGKQFATIFGKTIQFRDADTGNILRALPLNGTLFDFVFNSDGKQLACAISDRTKSLGAGGSVEIWDVESGKVLKTLRGHEGTIYGICFSPCGKWIASASSDKTVRIWDTKTGETVRTMKFAATVKRVAWGPDSTWMAVGTVAGKISLRDAATGDEILAIQTRTLDEMVLNAKGTLLAAAGLRNVQVWEISTPTAPPQREPPEAKKKQ
jgi:WD40 repeat protein